MPFDPDSYLGGTTGVTEESKKKSSFDPDAYLSSTETPTPTSEVSGLEQGLSMAAPAVTGYGMSGPGLNPTAVYEQGIKPFTKAGASTLSKYVQNPVKAAVDVGAMMLGSPVPPVGTIEMGKTLKNTYEAGREVIGNINDAISKLPKGTEVEAATFLNGLNPQDQQRLIKEINTKGLDRALKEFVPPEYLDEAGRSALSATQRAMPTGMSKLGRIIGPVARTAGRIAGPAGLAYDIYEAAPYIAQGGQELQSGRAAQMMRGAQQSMLNAPTGAPLSAQEAQNLYESGDQRLINIYKNDAELSNLIRRRAAEKALGPVAPQ